MLLGGHNGSFVSAEVRKVGLLLLSLSVSLSLLTDPCVHISVCLNRMIHQQLLMTLEEKMYWQ